MSESSTNSPLVNSESIGDDSGQAVVGDHQPAVSEPTQPPVQARLVWPAAVVASRMKLHWTFVVIAVLIIGMSFLMRSEGPTNVFLPGTSIPLPDACATKRLFGWDCPGCGMTRAFISISRGQFARAWQFNPASWLLYFFIAIQIPWNLMQIWLLSKRRRGIEVPYIHFAPFAILFVLLANWIWRVIL